MASTRETPIGPAAPVPTEVELVEANPTPSLRADPPRKGEGRKRARDGAKSYPPPRGEGRRPKAGGVGWRPPARRDLEPPRLFHEREPVEANPTSALRADPPHEGEGRKTARDGATSTLPPVGRVDGRRPAGWGGADAPPSGFAVVPLFPGVSPRHAALPHPGASRRPTCFGVTCLLRVRLRLTPTRGRVGTPDATMPPPAAPPPQHPPAPP
ncbi:hypothetical protein GCM10007904_40380 [Oharaeibacter diazotrophicus]|nr:hypothetical protein GCM10007904_40380 [Oharaeibacter diazotrophicus]